MYHGWKARLGAGQAGQAGLGIARPSRGWRGQHASFQVSLWSCAGQRRGGSPLTSPTSLQTVHEVLYLERRKKQQRRKKSEIGQAQHGAQHATDTHMHQPVPTDVIPRAAFGRQAAVSHRSGLCFLCSPCENRHHLFSRGRESAGGSRGALGGGCWAALLGSSPLCPWVASKIRASLANG